MKRKYSGKHNASVRKRFRPASRKSSRVSKMSRSVKRSAYYKRKYRRNRSVAEDHSSVNRGFVYGYGPRRRPRINKLLAPAELYRNGYFVITSSVGYQGIDSTLDLYNYADLLDIDANAPTSSNQYIKHLGGSLQAMFTNQSQCAVNVKIYHLITRRDNRLDPAGVWISGMSSQTGNANAAYYLNQVPYSSQTFTEQFKIKKATSFNMIPGGNATVFVRANNYACMREQLWHADNLQHYRGLTYSMLIVIRGYPLNDETGGLTVSTANVKVDVIWTKKLKFTYIDRFTQGGNVSDTLPHNAFTPHTIMQEDGNVEVVDNA